MVLFVRQGRGIRYLLTTQNLVMSGSVSRFLKVRSDACYYRTMQIIIYLRDQCMQSLKKSLHNGKSKVDLKNTKLFSILWY